MAVVSLVSPSLLRVLPSRHSCSILAWPFGPNSTESVSSGKVRRFWRPVGKMRVVDFI